MQKIIQQRVQVLTDRPINEIVVRERPRLTYQSNNLYDVFFDDTHWIAKEFVKEDEFEESPLREYNALKLLQPYDIAPIPIDFMPYPDYEHPIVLYEFMAGEMWDRRKPSAHDLGKLAEVWLTTYKATRAGLWKSRLLADSVLANVNRYRHNFKLYQDWAEHHFPAGVPHVQRANALFDKRADTIQQLNDESVTDLFSRADPRFANIIARPDGRVGFVDWEDSGLRSPMRTVCGLLYHANQEDLLTFQEWQAFLIPLMENYPVKEDDIHVIFKGYRAIIPIAWLSFILRWGVNLMQNNHDGVWLVNTMKPNQRLRRYFAHALNWEDDNFEAHLRNCEGIQFFPEITSE